MLATPLTPPSGPLAPEVPPGFGHVADGGLIQVRLPGDEAHVTAEGAFAEQRALRSFQDLDAGEVHDARVDGARHRGIVDVEARGARRAEQVLPGDAADGNRARIGKAGRTAAVGKGQFGVLVA